MKFKDYEIRPTLDIEGNECKDKYELVKWRQYDDDKDKRHCFVIAWLEWNPYKPGWSIRSVGMRLMRYWSSGLDEYVQRWADMGDVCMKWGGATIMDNLVKALRCQVMDRVGECKLNCPECEYYQREYKTLEEEMDVAAHKIEKLQKSNRNWRRKVQRLRKELKEVKENGIS